VILVIAVSYFGSKDLAPYLESLRAQTYAEWRLVIIDNSEDDVEWNLIQKYAANDPRVDRLRAPENLGYFGAVDWAVKQSNLREIRWLIVSNTDVRLANDEAFTALMSVSTDGIGVLAPSIRSSLDGRDQNPYQLDRPTVAQMRRRRYVLGSPLLAQIAMLILTAKRLLMRDPAIAVNVLNSQPIYAAHGSFFAVTKTFLDRGGNFEFPLFLFAEELFLAEQARDLGLQTVYAPDVKVEHLEHSQIGYLRSFKMLRHGARAARYGYALLKAEKHDDVKPERHNWD